MKTVQSIVVILIVLAFVLVGCGGSGDAIDPTVAVDVDATPELPAAATEMPIPTTLPPVGVLLVSPEADPVLAEHVQSYLSQAVPEAGLRFQLRPSLSAEDIYADDIQWVIALPPAPDLNNLITSSPGTRFLTIGVENLAPAANLTMIGADGGRADQQGFVAGYLAAMITPDWRVGVISVADTEAGQMARRGFLTGVKFYCGFCSPTYPPFYEYPFYVQFNAGVDTAEWQSGADFLLQRGVETVFVAPGAGDEALLQYIAQTGMTIISGEQPPEAIYQSWVATIGFSPLEAFFSSWPDFAAGSDLQTVSVPLSVSNVNPDLISPGKLRLLEQLLWDVDADLIELVADDIP